LSSFDDGFDGPPKALSFYDKRRYGVNFFPRPQMLTSDLLRIIFSPYKAKPGAIDTKF